MKGGCAEEAGSAKSVLFVNSGSSGLVLLTKWPILFFKRIFAVPSMANDLTDGMRSCHRCNRTVPLKPSEHQLESVPFENDCLSK